MCKKIWINDNEKHKQDLIWWVKGYRYVRLKKYP